MKTYICHDCKERVCVTTVGGDAENCVPCSCPHSDGGIIPNWHEAGKKTDRDANGGERP